MNNEKVTEPWFDVKEDDIVEIENVQYVVSTSDKKIYYVIHKPKGYVSSLYDPKEEKNIGNLLKEKLPNISKKLRIAGRLDKDVTGVLILTNDGELINILTNAKFEVKKVYLAKVKGEIQHKNIKDIKNGIIDNGEFLKCEDIKIIFEKPDYSILEIT
ncbi:MAG: pseudouridine synthase, partial [Fervidobacterium sp.]